MASLNVTWGGGRKCVFLRILGALLMKWIWRLYRDREGGQVCEVLKSKYLSRSSLGNCRGTYGSQLWKGLQKVKVKFEWGDTFRVNNGKKTKFW